MADNKLPTLDDLNKQIKPLPTLEELNGGGKSTPTSNSGGEDTSALQPVNIDISNLQDNKPKGLFGQALDFLGNLAQGVGSLISTGEFSPSPEQDEKVKENAKKLVPDVTSTPFEPGKTPDKVSFEQAFNKDSLIQHSINLEDPLKNIGAINNNLSPEQASKFADSTLIQLGYTKLPTQVADASSTDKKLVTDPNILTWQKTSNPSLSEDEIKDNLQTQYTQYLKKKSEIENDYDYKIGVIKHNQLSSKYRDYSEADKLENQKNQITSDLQKNWNQVKELYQDAYRDKVLKSNAPDAILSNYYTGDSKEAPDADKITLQATENWKALSTAPIDSIVKNYKNIGIEVAHLDDKDKINAVKRATETADQAYDYFHYSDISNETNLFNGLMPEINTINQGVKIDKSTLEQKQEEYDANFSPSAIDKLKKERKVLTPEAEKYGEQLHNLILNYSDNISARESASEHLLDALKQKTPALLKYKQEEAYQTALLEQSPFATSTSLAIQGFTVDMGYHVAQSVAQINALVAQPKAEAEVANEKILSERMLDILPYTKHITTEKPFGEYTKINQMPIAQWDKESKLGFSVNWTPLWYTTLKGAGDNIALGIAGEGFGALGKKGIESIIGTTLEKSIAESTAASLSTIDNLKVSVGGGLERGAILTGQKAGMATGFIVSSMLMNNPEMIRTEMDAKGLNFEQASKLSLIRNIGNTLAMTALPYQTLMPKFLKGTLTPSEIGELTENQIYKASIIEGVERATGKKLSDGVYSYIFNPTAKSFLKGVGLTTLEIGLQSDVMEVSNALADLQAKKYKSDYNATTDLSVGNLINTFITSAVTMLPFAVVGGTHRVDSDNFFMDKSNYKVGQAPELYKNSVDRQFANGDITKEEAARRKGVIDNLSTIYAGNKLAYDIIDKPRVIIDPITKKDISVSDLEKDGMKQQLFKISHTESELAKDLEKATTDKQREDIDKEIIKAGELRESVLQDIQKKILATPEERAEFVNIVKNKNFDNTYNERALNKLTTPEEAQVTITELRKSLLTEKNPELVEKTNSFINKVLDKFVTLRPMENVPQEGTINIERPGREPISLKLNHSYYLTNYQEPSIEGHKVFTKPEIKIVSELPDGHLQISFPDGSTGEISKEDLGKYTFNSKETVDEWRKKDSKGKQDPRAFVFDNINDVFSYSFAKETADRAKEPKGRIKYDTNDNVVKFVYKDKNGNTKEQVVSSSDFNPKNGKLKRVRTLETQEQFEAREAKYQEEIKNTDLEKLDKQATWRKAIFEKFIKDESDKLTKVHDKEIKDLTKKIEKLRKVMADIKSIAKLTNKDLALSDVKKFLNSEELNQFLGTLPLDKMDLGKPVAKYHLLKALGDKVNTISADVENLETNLKSIQEDRERVIEQLGADYESITSKVYDSDEKLTTQVKAYNDALKEQFAKNSLIMDAMQKLVERTKEALNTFTNRIKDLIGPYEHIAFDPTAEEEELPKTDAELRQIITEAEDRFSALSGENDRLSSEISKLDKVQDFLKKEEKKFAADRNKMKLQKTKDSIYESQHGKDGELQDKQGTGVPEEDEKNNGLKESNKIELGELFASTTSKEEKNEKGEIINPSLQRLQTFLNTVRDIPEKFRLLVVTKDNAEKYGLKDIIFTDDKTTNKSDNQEDNDIKTVLVKKDLKDGKPVFVDKEGNGIEPTKDNVVFTSIRKANLRWNDGQVNYHIDNLSGEVPQAIKDEAELRRVKHIEFRQALIDNSKLEATDKDKNFSLPIISVSRGIENQHSETPKSVQGNVIPEKLDLSKEQVVQLPKLEKPNSITGQVQSGNKNINMPVGRPVLKFGQTLLFLTNRKFGKEDASKFSKLFAHMYDEAKKTGKIDANIIAYLKKVLYWRNPEYISKITGEKQNPETIGRNQVWYDAKDYSIHIGNQGFKIPFEFEADNKKNISDLEIAFTPTDNTQSIFHNIDEKGMMEPFTEIVDVKRGKPVIRTWNTYQEYLLSNKLPDGITDRPVDEIPLTTNLTPSTEAAPNITGRYITYEHPLNNSVLRTTLLESNPEPTPTGEWKEVSTPISETEISPNKQYKLEKTTTQVNNLGEPENIFKSITFKADGSVVEHTITDKKTGKKLSNTIVKNSLVDLLKDNAPGWKFSERGGEPTTSTTATTKVDLNKPEVKSTETTPFVAPIPVTELNTPATELTSSVKPEEEKALLESLNKLASQPAPKDFNYRLAQGRIYKMENLMEAKKFVERVVPQLDFSVVSGLIHGKAWGLFRGKMIQLSNVAEEGTVYHEVFEAVYGLFLGKRGQKALHDEFRRRVGSFIDYESGKEIKYSEATDKQVKEQISEEYRELELSNGEKRWEGQSIKENLFKRMYNFVKDFIFGNPDTIQQVFDKITNAAYKDAIPHADLQDVQPNYRLADVKKQNPVFFNDLMKSVTNILFENLNNENRSIPEILTSNYNIAKEYVKAKAQMDSFYGGKDVLKSFTAFDKESFIKLFSSSDNFDKLLKLPFAQNWARFSSEKKLNLNQSLEKLYDSLKNYEFIDKNWDEIKKSHMDFLAKYQIEFKTNGGEELLKDEESNQGDIVDQLKLSRKYNANTEIKLLIATLREQEYKEVVRNAALGIVDRVPVNKLNTLLMSNLVDYHSTINSLLHKFVNTTNFDEIANSLKEEVLRNPSLQPIVDKLKLETPVDQLSAYDVDLRNKFYTSMSNMKAESEKLSVDPSTLTGSLLNLNEENATRLIKDEWLTSLKGNTKIIGVGKNSELELKKDALKTKAITDITKATEFLKELGFKIDVDPTKFKQADKDVFLKATSELFKVMHSQSPDFLFYENAFTKASLDALADVYTKYAGDYSEPQHLNIEREAVQNIILHNSYGLNVKKFNASTTLEDLFQRIPQMNPDNKGNAYQKYSQILKKGGLFFNMDGERRKDISIEILEGSEVKETLGTPTSKLHLTDKIAQDISANLNGVYTILVPADTKTEWGIRLGELATKLQAGDDKYVTDKFKDYLRAEILAVQQFQKDGSSLQRLNQSVDGVKIGEQLRFFKDILKGVTLDITSERDVEDIIKFREKDIDDAIQKFVNETVEQTYKYLKDNGAIVPFKAEESESSPKTTAFVPGQIEEEEENEDKPKLTLAFAPKSQIGEGLTEQEVRDLVRYADVNNMFAMQEQFKMFWGDPAQWKDITKRVKSFTSPRKLSISDAKYFNDWHNEFSNKLSFTDKDGNIQNIDLEEGDFGHAIYDDIIRTQTLKDVKLVSSSIDQISEITHNQKALELFNKPYKELEGAEKAKVDGQVESNGYQKVNEADGQAWSPYIGYRQIKQRDSSWGDAEEEVYQWDNALCRLDNNLYPTDTEGNITSKGELLKAHDEVLKEKGNPYLNRAKEGQDLPVFNILKPIYAGLKEGETMTANLDKMSIAPISWRAVKGTNSEQFYLEHVKNGSSYIKMESVQKVGNLDNIEPLYHEDGKVNSNVSHEMLNFRDFGIQVETSTQKDTSPMGTQLTKQATINMMSGGVPKDFLKSNPDGAKDKWESMTEKEKLSSSENYRHVRANNTLLAALKEQAKNKIFKDFGVDVHEDENGQKSYVFNSLQKMQNLIQRELNNRDVPENIKDYARINPNDTNEEKFYLPFDLIIGSEKIESLFTSIIDKNVLRPKINGGQMPQMASTLFEKGERNFVYKNAEGKYEKVDDLNKLSAEEKATVKLTSNHLKFYEMTEDGKTVKACEVMVPNFFREYFEQGKELDFSKVPKELLQGIGFRIPTQGLNSVEHFVIKGFLPVEYGDAIMVPSEITTKAGSDFDIDKLNIYLHNYKMKNGLPEKIKYLDESNSTTRERFEIVHRGNTKALARLDMIIAKDYEKNVLFNETDPVTDKLWTAIFGKYNEDTFEYNNDEVDELLKEQGTSLAAYNKIKEASIQEKLDNPDSSIDDFGKQPMEMQNTKKAVENQYIDNLRDILSMPENYSQLVEPNSAKVLEDGAKDINKLYEKDTNAFSWSNFLNRKETATTRTSFQQGKDAVGIGASALSQHGISQVVGLEFDHPYETTLDKTFNFDTNSEVKDGKLFYNLSSDNSRDGRSISSTISAFLNAFVDIAKDPFIFDINGNYNTAGYYITGVRLGIPIDTLIRWFNQPIIREFTDELAKRNSILTKATGIKEYPKQIAERLKAKYGVGEATERVENYNNAELDGYIKEYVEQQKNETQKYSRKFSDGQGNLLNEFVKLQSLSWDLFRYGQGISYDTTRTTSLDSIRIKFAKTIVALNGRFGEYVNKAFNDTFIGNIVNAKFEYLHALSQFYITESPKAREILNPILNGLYNSGLKADIIEKVATEMRKQFITYLLHTTPISMTEGATPEILTSSISPLFKGEDNIAVRLRKLQSAMTDGKIDENYFAKNIMGILPIVLKDANIANLKLIKKAGDKFESDLLTGDFANLKNNAKTAPLYEDLVKTALLQNGLVNSFNSYSNLIPNEDFHRIAEQVFKKFDIADSDVLTNFKNSYYENSWKNASIVPRTEAKTSAGKTRINTDKWLQGNNLTFMDYWVDSNQEGRQGFKMSREARNPYLLTSKLKVDVLGEPLYSKRTREEMAKKGDYSFLEQILWKRLEIMNPHTGELDTPLVKESYPNGDNFRVLYYPVNKKGSGNNLVEHYTGVSHSAINDKVQLIKGQNLYNALIQVGQMSDLWLNQHYLPTADKNYSLSLNLLTDEQEGENGRIDESNNYDQIEKILPKYGNPQATKTLELFEKQKKLKEAEEVLPKEKREKVPIEGQKEEVPKKLAALPSFEGDKKDPLTPKDCI